MIAMLGLPGITKISAMNVPEKNSEKTENCTDNIYGASQHAVLDCIHHWIDKKFNLNTPHSQTNLTPLAYAIIGDEDNALDLPEKDKEKRSVAAISVLINNGASVHFITQGGTNLLNLAIRRGYLSIIKLLIERGAQGPANPCYVLNNLEPYYRFSIVKKELIAKELKTKEEFNKALKDVLANLQKKPKISLDNAVETLKIVHPYYALADLKAALQNNHFYITNTEWKLLTGKLLGCNALERSKRHYSMLDLPDSLESLEVLRVTAAQDNLNKINKVQWIIQRIQEESVPEVALQLCRIADQLVLDLAHANELPYNNVISNILKDCAAQFNEMRDEDVQ